MTTAAPLHIAEASARKYLALAQEKNIHDRVESAEAIGYLTDQMQGLLDSLQAAKSKPRAAVKVDPLLREFVGDLADRLRIEGMEAAADRIVELTAHTLRIADEHLASVTAAA